MVMIYIEPRHTRLIVLVLKTTWPRNKLIDDPLLQVGVGNILCIDEVENMSIQWHKYLKM
jgi:hypothetical protein